MRRERPSLLPLLAVLFACLLALRIRTILFASAPSHDGALAFKTVIVAGSAAPVTLRRCASRFDGSRTRGDVQLATASRPIVSYHVRWQAFDTFGHAGPAFVIRYDVGASLRRARYAIGSAAVDVDGGSKRTLIDHVTCRLVDVTFAHAARPAWRSKRVGTRRRFMGTAHRRAIFARILGDSNVALDYRLVHRSVGRGGSRRSAFRTRFRPRRRLGHHER